MNGIRGSVANLVRSTARFGQLVGGPIPPSRQGEPARRAGGSDMTSINADSRAGARIHPSAFVHERAVVGRDTAVWSLAHVREDARIGTQCVIGQGAYIGARVRVGDRVKIQSYALIYEPAHLGDGVFVGP